MPSYQFFSDTNQQLFEACLEDLRVDFARTEKVGFLLVSMAGLDALARDYGADLGPDGLEPN